MKKIIISRRLLKESEEKALKLFDVKLNSNDELYSQSKLIESSQGYDAILTSLTDKMDEETINKLPDTIKIISNFAVGFGNINLEAAKKKRTRSNQYTRSTVGRYSRNWNFINIRCLQKSFRGN
jgi:lactate dehydrogenase-like 2-hydroxyacid dehydrogenase